MRGEAFERFKGETQAGLFLDFDGTLSDIVEVPSAARPREGVRDLLSRLTDRFPVVSVVSGRSAHELLDWLGPEVEIWGLHGAERTANGEVILAPAAAAYEETMRAVLREAGLAMAEPAFEGAVLEDKRAMVTFHYRSAVDVERAEEALDELVEGLAREHGLVRNRGKLALELQPPVSFSKRAVVLDRSREESLQAVCFAGDDVVDLPGFDAVDELKKEGVNGLKVAVDSAESPAPLIERADLVVDGPAGMMELLEELL